MDSDFQIVRTRFATSCHRQHCNRTRYGDFAVCECKLHVDSCRLSSRTSGSSTDILQASGCLTTEIHAGVFTFLLVWKLFCLVSALAESLSLSRMSIYYWVKSQHFKTYIGLASNCCMIAFGSGGGVWLPTYWWCFVFQTDCCLVMQQLPPFWERR